MKKSMFYEPKAVGNKVTEVKYTKEDKMNDLKWKIQKMKDLKDLAYIVEDELPEAKQAFKALYNKYKNEAMKELKAYSKMKKSKAAEESLTRLEDTLAKSFIEDNKETKMSKPKEELKEELLKSLKEKYKGKEITDEIKAEIQEEIKKALEAGYDIAEPAEELDTVDPGINLKTPEQIAAELPAEETPATTEEVVEEVAAADESSEEPAAEPKFASDLFKPFSLGTTIRQTPEGNVMDHMAKPSADYVEDYKNSTKNIKMTSEDFDKKPE